MLDMGFAPDLKRSLPGCRPAAVAAVLRHPCGGDPRTGERLLRDPVRVDVAPTANHGPD